MGKKCKKRTSAQNSKKSHKKPSNPAVSSSKTEAEPENSPKVQDEVLEVTETTVKEMTSVEEKEKDEIIEEKLISTDDKEAASSNLSNSTTSKKEDTLENGHLQKDLEKECVSSELTSDEKMRNDLGSKEEFSDPTVTKKKKDKNLKLKNNSDINDQNSEEKIMTPVEAVDQLKSKEESLEENRPSEDQKCEDKISKIPFDTNAKARTNDFGSANNQTDQEKLTATSSGEIDSTNKESGSQKVTETTTSDETFDESKNQKIEISEPDVKTPSDLALKNTIVDNITFPDKVLVDTKSNGGLVDRNETPMSGYETQVDIEIKDICQDSKVVISEISVDSKSNENVGLIQGEDPEKTDFEVKNNCQEQKVIEKPTQSKDQDKKVIKTKNKKSDNKTTKIDNEKSVDDFESKKELSDQKVTKKSKKTTDKTSSDSELQSKDQENKVTKTKDKKSDQKVIKIDEQKSVDGFESKKESPDQKVTEKSSETSDKTSTDVELPSKGQDKKVAATEDKKLDQVIKVDEKKSGDDFELRKELSDQKVTKQSTKSKVKKSDKKAAKIDDQKSDQVTRLDEKKSVDKFDSKKESPDQKVNEKSSETSDKTSTDVELPSKDQDKKITESKDKKSDQVTKIDEKKSGDDFELKKELSDQKVTEKFTKTKVKKSDQKVIKIDEQKSVDSFQSKKESSDQKVTEKSSETSDKTSTDVELQSKGQDKKVTESEDKKSDQVIKVDEQKSGDDLESKKELCDQKVNKRSKKTKVKKSDKKVAKIDDQKSVDGFESKKESPDQKVTEKSSKTSEKVSTDVELPSKDLDKKVTETKNKKSDQKVIKTDEQKSVDSFESKKESSDQKVTEKSSETYDKTSTDVELQSKNQDKNVTETEDKKSDQVSKIDDKKSGADFESTNELSDQKVTKQSTKSKVEKSDKKFSKIDNQKSVDDYKSKKESSDQKVTEKSSNTSDKTLPDSELQGKDQDKKSDNDFESKKECADQKVDTSTKNKDAEEIHHTSDDKIRVDSLSNDSVLQPKDSSAENSSPNFDFQNKENVCHCNEPSGLSMDNPNYESSAENNTLEDVTSSSDSSQLKRKIEAEYCSSKLRKLNTKKTAQFFVEDVEEKDKKRYSQSPDPYKISSTSKIENTEEKEDLKIPTENEEIKMICHVKNTEIVEHSSDDNFEDAVEEFEESIKETDNDETKKDSESEVTEDSSHKKEELNKDEDCKSQEVLTEDFNEKIKSKVELSEKKVELLDGKSEDMLVEEQEDSIKEIDNDETKKDSESEVTEDSSHKKEELNKDEDCKSQEVLTEDFNEKIESKVKLPEKKVELLDEKSEDVLAEKQEESIKRTDNEETKTDFESEDTEDSRDKNEDEDGKGQEVEKIESTVTLLEGEVKLQNESHEELLHKGLTLKKESEVQLKLMYTFEKTVCNDINSCKYETEMKLQLESTKDKDENLKGQTEFEVEKSSEIDTNKIGEVVETKGDEKLLVSNEPENNVNCEIEESKITEEINDAETKIEIKSEEKDSEIEKISKVENVIENEVEIQKNNLKETLDIDVTNQEIRSGKMSSEFKDSIEEKVQNEDIKAESTITENEDCKNVEIKFNVKKDEKLSAFDGSEKGENIKSIAKSIEDTEKIASTTLKSGIEIEKVSEDEKIQLKSEEKTEKETINDQISEELDLDVTNEEIIDTDATKIAQETGEVDKTEAKEDSELESAFEENKENEKVELDNNIIDKNNVNVIIEDEKENESEKTEVKTEISEVEEANEKPIEEMEIQETKMEESKDLEIESNKTQEKTETIEKEEQVSAKKTINDEDQQKEDINEEMISDIKGQGELIFQLELQEKQDKENTEKWQTKVPEIENPEENSSNVSIQVEPQSRGAIRKKGNYPSNQESYSKSERPKRKYQKPYYPPKQRFEESKTKNSTSEISPRNEEAKSANFVKNPPSDGYFYDSYKKKGRYMLEKNTTETRSSSDDKNFHQRDTRDRNFREPIPKLSEKKTTFRGYRNTTSRPSSYGRKFDDLEPKKPAETPSRVCKAAENNAETTAELPEKNEESDKTAYSKVPESFRKYLQEKRNQKCTSSAKNEKVDFRQQRKPNERNERGKNRKHTEQNFTPSVKPLISQKVASSQVDEPNRPRAIKSIQKSVTSIETSTEKTEVVVKSVEDTVQIRTDILVTKEEDYSICNPEVPTIKNEFDVKVPETLPQNKNVSKVIEPPTKILTEKSPSDEKMNPEKKDQNEGAVPQEGEFNDNYLQQSFEAENYGYQKAYSNFKDKNLNPESYYSMMYEGQPMYVTHSMDNTGMNYLPQKNSPMQYDPTYAPMSQANAELTPGSYFPFGSNFPAMAQYYAGGIPSSNMAYGYEVPPMEYMRMGERNAGGAFLGRCQPAQSLKGREAPGIERVYSQRPMMNRERMPNPHMYPMAPGMPKPQYFMNQSGRVEGYVPIRREGVNPLDGSYQGQNYNFDSRSKNDGMDEMGNPLLVSPKNFMVEPICSPGSSNSLFSYEAKPGRSNANVTGKVYASRGRGSNSVKPFNQNFRESR